MRRSGAGDVHGRGLPSVGTSGEIAGSGGGQGEADFALPSMGGELRHPSEVYRLNRKTSDDSVIKYFLVTAPTAVFGESPITATSLSFPALPVASLERAQARVILQM